MSSLKMLCILFSVGFLPSAEARIVIDQGVYAVPAIVAPTRRGLTAIFNMRTRSEARIVLKGHVAEKLKLESPKLMRLRFKLAERMTASQGEAELLEATPVAEGERVPLHVGNNLKAQER